MTDAEPTAAEVAAVADAIVLQSPGQVTFDAAGETLVQEHERVVRGAR